MKHICQNSISRESSLRLYTPFIMYKIFTLLFLSVSILSAGQSNSSQPSVETNQTFYVQASDLNLDRYSDLHVRIKNDGKFSISTACVPAHIMEIKILNTPTIGSVNAGFELFRALCIESQIQQVTLLSDFNYSLFEQQCKSARSGN